MGNGNLTLHIIGSMIEEPTRARTEIDRSRGRFNLEKFWSTADRRAHTKSQNISLN